jgi:hypothetical protein
VAISVVLGAALGLILASAPAIAGDTAVTDPVVLGVMWFVRPQSITVLAPPLIHLGLGIGVGALGMLARAMHPTVVILTAVSVNGAATVVENGYGAGVVGVLWWLLGTALSAVLMLFGVRVARCVAAMRAPAPHPAQIVSR